jgi:prepilin-type N-terminal cleavage/methylation domain-containing protein
MRKRLLKNEDGFTLIEVLLSLALLGIGAVLLVTFLGTSVRMLRDASAITASNAEAAGQTEADASSGTGSSGTLTVQFGADAVVVNGTYTSNGSYISFVPS